MSGDGLSETGREMPGVAGNVGRVRRIVAMPAGHA